jgi:hypothetical protein
MSQISNYLKSQQNDMVTVLEQWVNQDSPTYNKPAVDAIGQMIRQAFVESGATLTTVHSQPAKPKNVALQLKPVMLKALACMT